MSQIKPATHEAKGHLYYYPVFGEQYDGLAPYWALSDLVFNHFDGHGQVTFDIDGEGHTADLAYSGSGIAPRPSDDVTADSLSEIELHVEGHSQRKCHFNISPRFEQMQHYEDGEDLTFPFHHLDADAGLTIQFQAGNYDLHEIPVVLTRALFELADEADIGLHHRYFDQPGGGRIEEIERYVRITRDWNSKLIETGMLIDRLSMLLSSQRGTKGKYRWDNTDEKGSHHQVRLGSTGAGKLIPNHQYGRQLKSYLPKEPQAHDEGDPLYHPKFGVLFRKSLHRPGSVLWENRHDLVREIDETILNCLSWADIPATVSDGQDGTHGGGSNGVFVADNHFDVVSRENSLPISEDPTPRLEAEQEHLLMTVLRDCTDSAADVVETIATDGGGHVDDVADETGYSLSTIYRVLQQLDGVLESREGHVKFVTQKIAEEIRGIVQSAEYAIENAADRAAKLFDIDVNQSSNSAVSRWLAEYAADFDAPDDSDGRPRIRIDTIMSELKSRSQPYLPDVLDYLVHAWITDGRRRLDIEETIVEVQLASGKRYEAPLRTLR